MSCIRGSDNWQSRTTRLALVKSKSLFRTLRPTLTTPLIGIYFVVRLKTSISPQLYPVLAVYIISATAPNAYIPPFEIASVLVIIACNRNKICGNPHLLSYRRRIGYWFNHTEATHTQRRPTDKRTSSTAGARI